MIAYLNGLGKPKFRPFGGKGKKILEKAKARGKKEFTKLKATGKKLNEQRKALDKKIIAKHKELAKKIGAGIKRFAKIGKSIQEKALLKALEKNLMGLSSRLKATYKVSPGSVKSLLKPMGDWEKIKSAINKGDKKQPAIIGAYMVKGRPQRVGQKLLKGMPVQPRLMPQTENESLQEFQNRKMLHKIKLKNYRADLEKFLSKGYMGEDEAPTEGAPSGAEAEQTAENVKQGVNLIQKIVEFFKKRKESKPGDSETIEAMANSVDADPNIEKVDEKGTTLPVSEEAKEISKADEKAGAGNEGGMMKNKTLLIGGAVALAVGGYFLLKKKK